MDTKLFKFTLIGIHRRFNRQLLAILTVFCLITALGDEATAARTCSEIFTAMSRQRDSTAKHVKAEAADKPAYEIVDEIRAVIKEDPNLSVFSVQSTTLPKAVLVHILGLIKRRDNGLLSILNAAKPLAESDKMNSGIFNYISFYGFSEMTRFLELVPFNQDAFYLRLWEREFHKKLDELPSPDFSTRSTYGVSNQKIAEIVEGYSNIVSQIRVIVERSRDYPKNSQPTPEMFKAQQLVSRISYSLSAEEANRPEVVRAVREMLEPEKHVLNTALNFVESQDQQIDLRTAPRTQETLKPRESWLSRLKGWTVHRSSKTYELPSPAPIVALNRSLFEGIQMNVLNDVYPSDKSAVSILNRKGYVHDFFKPWWWTTSQASSRITGRTTKSLAVTLHGKNVERVVYWPQKNRVPDIENVRVAVSYDGNKNPLSMEMLVRDEELGWLPYFFTREGEVWVRQEKVLEESVERKCMSCHVSDGRGSIPKGQLSPRPFFLKTEQDFFNVGYSDRELIKKFLSY